MPLFSTPGPNIRLACISRSSDVDLFLYGLDEGAATAKVKQMYAAVKHANPQVPQHMLNKSEYCFKPRNKSACKSI